MIGVISYKDLEQYEIVRPTTSDNSWYLILLGNLNNETPALKKVIDNYTYLNKRTKDVRFFVPGYLVNENGMEKPSPKSFYEKGFHETIEWLEENANNYEYSEDMEMILLPFKKTDRGTTIQYDFENMLCYDLDTLNDNTNIIKFILNGVKVIHQNMNPENTRQQMEGEQDAISLERIHKVFIAGSKVLERERDGIRSAFSQLSNIGNIWFKTMTYEDFDRSFIIGGRQNDYNTFISDEADSVIFVIDNRVGGITRNEFYIALESFNAKGHPCIYVYYKATDHYLPNPELNEIIQIINDNHQYYNDYSDLRDLKHQVTIDFTKLLNTME